MSGLVAATMLTSCSDEFLDQSPASSTNATEALVNDYDVLTALRGAYDGMSVVGLYGRNLPILGELLADNSFVAASNSGYFTSFPRYTFTRADGDISNAWTEAYDVINRTNAIINSDPVVTNQADIDQYKGEAYAIRALMYFELVRHFAVPYTENPSAPGVPIVLEFDYNAQPSRNTVAEVYAQIKSDLDAAYELINQDVPPTRISKYAARALASEVNLYTQDYNLALQYAEEVINESGHELLEYEDVVTYWNDPSAGSGYSETLFEIAATDTDHNGVNELGYFYHQGGYGQNLAAGNLYALYSEDDVRADLIIVGRRGADNPAYIVNKYPNIAGDRDDKAIIRMSEVYLIAAEAAARLNQEDLARTYLNALVSERDPDLEYTSSGQQLIDNIILERRKELAFEGDRFHTLNRLMLDITDRPANPTTVEYGDYRRVLPIPQSEIDANDNIAQNEGWGG
ncbi:RagB/SusD family nutrient uptake outer membrane protein [Pontibacter korlensis]|uniref:Carbohydrate-binding protein SusD n=3 Tax=Pontibacter korlensis TaxID=400092 RepID=A0A0E3ZEM9_9BACT|nr:hypothetical protein PKOR_08080 [Pontibacter korlensis]